MPTSRFVQEVVRRRTDGVLFDVIGITRTKAIALGYRFVRMGPSGEHRAKRKWIPLDEALNLYEAYPSVERREP